MVYSLVTRENVVADDDVVANLTELGANSPGTVTVPNSSLLTGVFINCAPDWTADAHYGFSSAVTLTGSGVGGHQAYGGPCGATVGLAVGSCGLSEHPAQRYKTRIPVVPGQNIDIHGWMHGEDMGALNMAVTLEFDGVPGVCKDFDYREEILAAANTPVVLGAKLGLAEAYFRPSSKQIGEIHVNGGMKPIAGPLGTVVQYSLYGPAMPTGGEYQFIGCAYATQDDTGAAAAVGGGGSVQSNNIVYTIPRGNMTLAPGTFQCQAQMLEDDIGDVFAIITIGYI